MIREPLLLRFRTLVAVPPADTLRYDPSRSIGQCLGDGAWGDRLDVASDDPHTTRVTKVRMETTDDE